MSLLELLPKDLLLILLKNLKEIINKNEKNTESEKELKIRDNIFEAINSISYERIAPYVYRCGAKNCENFEVSNDKYPPYYFDNICIERCCFCGEIHYCEHHDILDIIKEKQYDDEYKVCKQCCEYKLKEGNLLIKSKKIILK